MDAQCNRTLLTFLSMNFVLRVLLLSASRSELQVRPNVVASEILHCHVFSLMKIRKFASVFVKNCIIQSKVQMRSWNSSLSEKMLRLWCVRTDRHRLSTQNYINTLISYMSVHTIPRPEPIPLRSVPIGQCECIIGLYCA